MAYSLTVAGYTFQNPPESYRKQASVGNNPQPAVDKEATDFYQSDSQDLQFVVEGTLALDPPLGEPSDDLAELERLQEIAIQGGEVDVEFDPFFSGTCIIEDDPFRQSEGESSYKFTFTINSESTDSTAYPVRSPPDTGNTFELGSLDIGYDPRSVSQNYERQTEQVKRLQGIARSIDNAGLVPKVRVSGMIDGEGQDKLWEKARNNVLAYLSAEFQKGWCLIDSLSIRNSPEAPDYLDGLFRYDLDVLIVKDPGSGIGNVSSYVNQTVKRTGTYAGSSSSGDSDFSGLEFTVDGGSGSLDGDYIEWNQTTVTLSDNDTNYVYVDDADNDGYGQVKVNQSAFPADALELYRVEVSGGGIQKVVDVRAILIEDRDSEEGGDDGGETIEGDVYFTVFGGDYEIVSGTTSSWNDTRLLLASNDRNYIWVEDTQPNGSAQVQTATSGYPSSGNFIQMYRVDTDADSVTNIIDDRPSDISDGGSDTSNADLNLKDDLRLRDQNLDFERLLALADSLSLADQNLLPAVGILSLSDTLAVAEGPLDGLGIASFTDSPTLIDGGSASGGGGGTTTETLSWGTASDWDNAVSETLVDHGSVADRIRKGFYDNFEDTDFSEYTNTGAVSRDSSRSYTGSYSAFLDESNGVLDYNFSQELTHIHLEFWVNYEFDDRVDERVFDSSGTGYQAPFMDASVPEKVLFDGNRDTAYNPNADTWYREEYDFHADTDSNTLTVFDTNNTQVGSVTSGNYQGGTGIAEWKWATNDNGSYWIDELYFRTRLTSSLTTATKSFGGGVQPDLENLQYSLNGESITITVIGSPGTASEEQVTQSLGGASSYTLSWANDHTDFRVKIQMDTGDVNTTPTLQNVDLTGTYGSSGDPDQNPNTTWEIQGAKYDSSGNEYEGGGVVSRYGAD